VRPSKTQLKQVSHALQALGQALVELPEPRLAALPISEALLQAVREFKSTRSHEGRRRQMQYIGKLMRRTDPEPIRQAVAETQLDSAQDTLALHEAERWRNELIADDDALTRWVAMHPQTDLQQLRSLVRGARKDASHAPEERSGKAYRELFQFIKQASRT
jgi:ribosome-associated protein